MSSQVSHANLSPTLAAQLDRPPYYTVAPYHSGLSLRHTIDHVGAFVVPHALWIARQLAAALSALHHSGWLHADLKPANIVVARNGHATLLDLGLARRLPVPRHSESVGVTPRYAAPEWFSETTPPSAASDLFSLGAVLFEMVTGRCLARMCGQLPVTFMDPRRLVPSVPRDIATLIRRMLHAEPLRRPTAAEVETQLVRLEVETLADRCPEGDDLGR